VGWGVVDGSRIRREYPITLGRIEGHGRRGKALKADDVLEYCNTKLASVEAKAWDAGIDGRNPRPRHHLRTQTRRTGRSLKIPAVPDVLGEFIEKQELLDTCQQLSVGFDDVQTKAPKASDRKGDTLRRTARLAR
jgi:hypothetical protein